MGNSTQHPAPTTTTGPPPSLEAAEQALRASWTLDTSDDPSAWSPENPAAGQCTASTLVIRALYGGEIVVADVLDEQGQVRSDHAWNVLPSGEEVDFTFSQFRKGERLGPETAREPTVEGDPARVQRLAERVSQLLGVPVDLGDAAA